MRGQAALALSVRDGGRERENYAELEDTASIPEDIARQPRRYRCIPLAHFASQGDEGWQLPPVDQKVAAKFGGGGGNRTR